MTTNKFTDEEIEKARAELKHIKEICEFQSVRIADEESVNKRLVLRQALNFINHHTTEIRTELNLDYDN